MKFATLLLSIALASVLSVALTSCNNVKSGQAVYYTCGLITDAEPVVATAIRQGVIKRKDFPKVDSAIAFASPICGANPQPSVLDPSVYNALIAASVDLLTARKAAEAAKH